MTSAILAPTIALNSYLSSTFIPTLPLPLTAVLHAARVSLAYRAIRARVRATYGARVEGNEAKDGWILDIAGFLVMSWGGSFLTAYLSGNIPVQLLSITPLLTYVSVHFYLTILMSYIPVSAVWLDTLMPLIDGATRTMAVVGGVTLARTNLNPLAAQSLLFQIVLGTVGACGGGQLAGTLNVFNPDLVGWSFSTPPVFKSRNLLEAIDVIAALLGSITFTIFTGSHPAWTPLLARAGLVVPNKYTRNIFHWSDAEGKAATTLVIAACFAYRALLTHWSTLAPKSTGQRVEIEQKKEKKGVKSAAIGGGKGAK